ncbi:endopeptidase La [Salisediminibacterium halotolerans]|uniref:Lon protease n=1 Tax=Salisediminibacterium halotolerans TaxID=517425 RepID=A0A1H9U3H8_9BACI|nr:MULTISPECIES: endopeptidase La [Salisediminibacterium]RLJ81104.1 ATP-dependent proteinase [Actinophytocola xinjiangensis]RPE84087.1 ATP-dependent proteinase [Salisediminibacterium halotolerans]TWG38531.1 ATP-dependent proteinase [Salisediminibacterium halotolerans]SES03788.1 ATP-dependent Lon protease [Salisediminibacterium haloalkalitolerans]GEL07193.1 Lon protease 1 [Salisediminibacterium halotolerans]
MSENQHKTVPLLPLRGMIVFPTMVLHLDVGRDRSVKALEKAMVEGEEVFLTTQQEVATDEPDEDDIYEIGTVAKVNQMLKLPNGTIRVLVEGLQRGKIDHYVEYDDHAEVELTMIGERQEPTVEEQAIMRNVLEQFEQYIQMSKKITQETFASVSDIVEPGRLADIITSHLPLKIVQKQEILETLPVEDRLRRILDVLTNEKEVLGLEKKIGQEVKKSMEKTQKEYYLREQMKAIQKELGEREGKESEVEELREKVRQAEMPDNIEEKALKELKRYERMPASSAESSVIRNYIEWLVQIPWTDETEDVLDIHRSEKILDEDHHGLEKVKERVLEYLAVQQLTNRLKGPILCLTGPPGVGKTSLARSVARSLNRNFVRMSLGGVRDEAEIRGHRRTYVGSMPGRIVQGMYKAGTVNPVFLLDEIDKMAHDFRGDPSSALLEVLDPEQNNTFSDHFIEEPYDLSKVMFITTANNISQIPAPLQDRMEMIHIPGYTEVEKMEIAKGYLLPKQIKEHGLSKGKIQVKDEAVLKVIRHYTREAGVRSLERQMAMICRKAAKMIVSGDKKRVIVTENTVEDLLGKPQYRYGKAETQDQVGAATGLAYTSAGGDTLTIEVSVSPGKGKLTLTGKLGDVMKESAQAAFSYIRSKSDELNIDPSFNEDNDIHIHVPEGAIPKDGPSAGITMATALISALTGRPVKREVGMTGEITLRGRVLPIGGLKEKAMSAHRAGLTHIIMPKENEKDLEDIPKSVRDGLTFIAVSHLDEVLKHALTGERS